MTTQVSPPELVCEMWLHETATCGRPATQAVIVERYVEPSRHCFCDEHADQVRDAAGLDASLMQWEDL